jgi:hypothetical protein
VAGPGSVPPYDERYEAAEVIRLDEDELASWQEDRSFEVWLEAFFESATDEELDAYRNGVMRVERGIPTSGAPPRWQAAEDASHSLSWRQWRSRWPLAIMTWRSRALGVAPGHDRTRKSASKGARAPQPARADHDKEKQNA